MTDPAGSPVTIVPANEASWGDLQAVFGTRGDPSRCRCQRYKMQPGESWASVGREELAYRFRAQTECEHPKSGTTSGLVAYLDGEPVGWCAVEPRSHHPPSGHTGRPIGRGWHRRACIGTVRPRVRVTPIGAAP